jgi:predicted MarR family transcription regulator
MQNNLVEMQTLGGKVTYTLTQRGVTVLRHFRELRKVVPLDEEDRKIPPMLR